jgi:hypothetical protein
MDLMVQEIQGILATKLDCTQDCSHYQQERIQLLQVSSRLLLATMLPYMPVYLLDSMELHVACPYHCQD